MVGSLLKSAQMLISFLALCLGAMDHKRFPSSLAPWRELSVQEEISGDNIFGNGGDRAGNSSDLEGDTSCVFPDAFGDFGADNPYTDAVLVAWRYQLQGTISLSANTVRTEVIPQLERLVSKLLVERLFNTPVCEEQDSQYTSSVSFLRDGGRKRGRRRKAKQRDLELNSWDLDNGSVVTGLLQEPQDTTLPNFDGVNCRNTLYIPDAPRCFSLIGGLTLIGQRGDIDEAVNITQEALQAMFNDETILSEIHEALRLVQYLEPEPDLNVYSGISEPETGDDLSDDRAEEMLPNNEASEGGSGINWPVWTWIILGSCFVLLVVAAFGVRGQRQRYMQRHTGSFGQIRCNNAAALRALQRSSDSSQESGSFGQVPSNESDPNTAAIHAMQESPDNSQDSESTTSSDQNLPSNRWKNIAARKNNYSSVGLDNSGNQILHTTGGSKNQSCLRYYDKPDVKGSSLASGPFPDGAQCINKIENAPVTSHHA